MVPPSRREEIRRQRIESEQRRRDELRDGYRRLKDALPVSNQKSSKVSLLDRGMRNSSLLRQVPPLILLSSYSSHHAHQISGDDTAAVADETSAG